MPDLNVTNAVMFDKILASSVGRALFYKTWGRRFKTQYIFSFLFSLIFFLIFFLLLSF